MIGHLRKWGASFWHMGRGKQATIVMILAVILSTAGALGLNYYNEHVKKTKVDADQARIQQEVKERMANPIFKSTPEVKKLDQ